MAHKMTRRGFVVSAAACAAGVATAARDAAPEPLRAGAFAIDITPKKFPVIVNGMFTERKATRAHDTLHARCLVLAAGATRVAIAVVDSCLMPRELLDEAKALASRAAGIPVENMLISATHTHSAPAAVGALGWEQLLSAGLSLLGNLAQTAANRQADTGRIAETLAGIKIEQDQTDGRPQLRIPLPPKETLVMIANILQEFAKRL